MRRYIVERGRMGRGDRGVFKVSVEGEAHGGYLSEYAALLDAVDAAHASGKAGKPSQVLIRAKDGTETVKWTSGIDPYPYGRQPRARARGAAPLSPSSSPGGVPALRRIA